eukprot:c21653_g1_i1.p1 GENE.c21653_g1_i1~~c21653_g1_i1.p1  ORF type:complete len:957 (+),score=322.79 c21653_g1_i1:54-2924(+)
MFLLRKQQNPIVVFIFLFLSIDSTLCSVNTSLSPLIPKQSNTIDQDDVNKKISDRVKQISESEELINGLMKKIDNWRIDLENKLHNELSSDHFRIRSIIKILIDSFPSHLSQIVKKAWRSSFEDNPIIALALPPPTTEKSFEYSKEVSDISEAAWNVLDDISNILWREQIDILESYVFNPIPIQKSCGYLVQIDYEFSRTFENIFNSSSWETAPKEFEKLMASFVSRTSNSLQLSKDILTCVTPNISSNANLKYFISNIVNLPHVSKLVTKISTIENILDSKLFSMFNKDFDQTSAKPEEKEESSFIQTDSIFLSKQATKKFVLITFGCFSLLMFTSIFLFIRVYVQQEVFTKSRIAGISTESVVISICNIITVLGSIILVGSIFYWNFSFGKKHKEIATSIAVEVNDQMTKLKRKKFASLFSKIMITSELAEDLKRIQSYCQSEYIPLSECSLLTAYNNKDSEKWKKLLERLENGETLSTEKGLAKEFTKEEFENRRLFKAFFGTKSESIPSSEVLLKFQTLGLPDAQIRALIRKFDPKMTGSMTIKDFANYVLNPQPVDFMTQMSKYKFKLVACAIYFIASTVTFFGNSRGEGVYAPVFVLIVALGIFVGVRRLSNVYQNSEARALKDTQSSLAVEAVGFSVLVLVTFVIIHTLFLKGCVNGSVQCPYEVSVDPSLQDTTPLVDISCVDDIDNTVFMKSGDKCSSNIRCVDSTPIWAASRQYDYMVSYALAKYNQKTSALHDQPLTQSDFLSNSTIIGEIRASNSLSTLILCTTQKYNFPTTKISRARKSLIEPLLDFGKIVSPTKQVTFVSVNSPCPDASVQGKTVTPYPIGHNEEDLYYFVYGEKFMKFNYPIPDPDPAVNFFALCERQKSSDAWQKVTDATYVFGYEGTCGSLDCSAADYTSKIGNHPVTKVYFAVITALSIGYGDISPVSMRARMVAILHAMVMILLGSL